MKKKLGAVLTPITVGLIIALAVIPAGAAGGKVNVPALVSYQGYLTDDAGVPIDDSASIRFSIYEGPTDQD